jgi:hypothetical protein
MKFTRKRGSTEYWNGTRALPDEIHVMSGTHQTAEWELLTHLAVLHGHVTAFDLLTGSEADSEKDKDITSVLTAFQRYVYPRMPLSHYSSTETRLVKKDPSTNKVIPVDADKAV